MNMNTEPIRLPAWIVTLLVLLVIPVSVAYLTDVSVKATLATALGSLAPLLVANEVSRTKVQPTARMARGSFRRDVVGTATSANVPPVIPKARAAQPVTGIVIINKSSLVSSIDVQDAAAACALQIARDVAPAWGRVPMTVTLGTTAPPGSWPIFVFDHADQAGALGYHDETPDGHPYGKVFAVDCQKAGVTLSSCLSHEACEAFIDPACNLWADTGHHTAIALEVGDPVEDGSYTVTVNGRLVEVSNFVLPAYFDPRHAGGKVDHLGHLSAPFSRTGGGYVIVEKEGKVTQQFGKTYSRARRAAKKFPAARTARRAAQGVK